MAFAQILRKPSRRTSWWWVVGFALIACLGWVPFVGRTLSPDEGGYLLVAAQWTSGTSLYGDLWVDRPPLLIALFAVADALGGGGALRAMGVVTVVVTVLLAGVVGRLAAPTSGLGLLLPAGTAAVLVSSPLFGGSVVNGELLGLPFVLVGVAAALASVTREGRRSAVAWAVVAGAAAAAAVLVKQNLLDVLFFGLVLAVVLWRPGTRPTAVRLLVGAVAGGLLTTAVVLVLAAQRGTDPVDLWNAVVVFRGEAGRVIAQSGPGTNQKRLAGLVLAAVASGAVVVMGLLAWVVLRRPARTATAPSGTPSPDTAPTDTAPTDTAPTDTAPTDTARNATVPDLRWPAATVLVWEVVAVLAGGSFWLHYLLGLVPGLVLLAAAAAQRPFEWRRPHTAAYVFAVLSSLAVIGWVAIHPIERPEAPVIDYLADHARPGETAIVAFGGANILEESGLTSPYEYLWSLPVRVRDPRLTELAAVLASPERPTWLVVSGGSLGSWGIDPAAAAPYVGSGYALATHAGRFEVYHREGTP